MSGIQSIPYTIPFFYQYDTCPRFDRRYPDTLFNLVTGKSLYSFRNTSSRDQLLGHIGVKRMKKLHADGLLESLDYESFDTC